MTRSVAISVPTILLQMGIEKDIAFGVTADQIRAIITRPWYVSCRPRRGFCDTLLFPGRFARGTGRENHVNLWNEFVRLSIAETETNRPNRILHQSLMETLRSKAPQRYIVFIIQAKSFRISRMIVPNYSPTIRRSHLATFRVWTTFFLKTFHSFLLNSSLARGRAECLVMELLLGPSNFPWQVFIFRHGVAER